MKKIAIRLFYAGCASFMLLCFSGCTTVRVDERQAYWEGEIKTNLPSGASLEEAKQFFFARGLDLHCFVSGPDMDNAHLALEHKVGRFLWTEYDIAIVVDISKTQRVEKARVLRWGVGL
ncbi:MULTISPECIES: hypothetical protein [unclassified Duganella]|uniref:hypothetical protein n=1 Tax=unclassified Duganella TaxID=2636909 RepID=UPI0011C17359|nr:MULTISPECIES: hypothetical protein [unclassified Duganella]